MFRLLKQRDDGYRQTHDVVLRNQSTGEEVYVPPQGQIVIRELMKELAEFINDEPPMILIR